MTTPLSDLPFKNNVDWLLENDAKARGVYYEQLKNYKIEYIYHKHQTNLIERVRIRRDYSYNLFLFSIPSSEIIHNRLWYCSSCNSVSEYNEYQKKQSEQYVKEYILHRAGFMFRTKVLFLMTMED